MAAVSTNWIGLADVIVGAVLSLVMALVGFIFKQLRDEVKDSSRHLEGIMFSTWRILWRVDSAEDFLEKNHGYDPPRTVPEWPFNQ